MFVQLGAPRTSLLREHKQQQEMGVTKIYGERPLIHPSIHTYRMETNGRGTNEYEVSADRTLTLCETCSRTMQNG